MTRRLLVAALIGAASVVPIAGSAHAGTTINAGNGSAACAWLFSAGVCVVNPFNDLPTTPHIPAPRLP